jgi:hypothetical protein
MRSSRLLVFLCLVTNILFAQELEIKAKYGKVSEEELRMTYYSKDSSAEAVVLYEEAIVSFDYDNVNGITMFYSYFGRFKILKKSGLDHGIIKIPFYQGSYNKKEIIRNVDGCTYNLEDGKVVSSKLTKELIFHEHVFDEQYQDKIRMPNVKEGSVFEYRYIKETPFSVRHKPATWYFQGSIPVQWSEYNILIPTNLNYRIFKNGYLPFLTNTLGATGMKVGGTETTGTQYRVAVKDAPAFRNEAFITSGRDYISKIEFELTSIQFPNSPLRKLSETWENLDKTLLKTDHYEETFSRTGFLEPVIEQLKTVKDTMQCIQLAFGYVSKSLEWDGNTSVFPRTDAKKVYENKKGNVTEINLILVSLLKALGFDANPLILSTRENGKINEQYPSLDKFNYTIACVTLNGKDVLMDATDAFTKPGMLPERCLNGTGRLIKPGNSRFISLKPTEKNVQLKTYTASLNLRSGEIVGNAVISMSGYKAHSNRKKINGQGEAEVLKNFKKNNPEFQISNLKLEDNGIVSDPVKISFDFNYPDNIPESAIYFNPILSGRIKNNPFTKETRIYPVDMVMPSDDLYMGSIKIPEGYEVEEIPKSASILLHDNLGKFSYMVSIVGDEIKVVSRITLNEYYFAPEEYKFLKDFYDLIVQKQAQQIVLKKK